jgi:hypothetical protein
MGQKILFVYLRKTWFKFYQESGSARNPDPHSSEVLDPYPDPHIINADSKHCFALISSINARYFAALSDLF